MRKRKGEETEGPSWRRQRVVVAVRQESGVADFRPHDIRRTLTSWLAAGKVPKEVRDAILGHKPAGLEGVYNVYDYAAEKRKELERWARHLERLAAERADDKVVAMARA